MLAFCEYKSEFPVDIVFFSTFNSHKFSSKNSQFKAMSGKVKKEFVFHFPLKHKVVRDLKIVTEHVGDLVIEGVGYFNPTASPIDVFDRYAVDIDFVKWNETDIKPVLEVTGGLDEIEEAAIRYFAHQLENSNLGKAA